MPLPKRSFISKMEKKGEEMMDKKEAKQKGRLYSKFPKKK